MKKLNQYILGRPEYVFLVLALTFGLTFVFITPPIQSPDENRHFFRAYHISQGSLFAVRKDGRVGGYLPKSIKQSFSHFSELRGRKDLKTSKKQLIDVISQQQDDSMEFVDFPSVAVYTPVSYLPQAIGIRISRLFSDSIIVALYAGRLGSLFIWVMALFFAIKLTPIFKWLFVALALLPMATFIGASLSADVVTNAIVFLVLGLILKSAFNQRNFQTSKEFWVLVLLSALLASAKFLYTPVLLLFLIIPKERFKSKKQKFVRFGTLLLVVGLITVCWPLIQGVGYVHYADYNPQFREKVNLLECSNTHQQLAYIKAHASYLFVVIGNSIIHSFDVYAKGFIGNFGWGESPLPLFWLCFGYLGLILISFLEGTAFAISKVQRLVFLSTFAIVSCLVILSQLLIWTCVGNELVTNLQGRYFIPIVPLLFFSFYRSGSKMFKWLPVGVSVFSLSLLITSTVVIYDRFYVPIKYKTEVVLCDHETGSNSSDFGTSVSGVFAQNGFSRSNEKARSGKYASKLSPLIQYGTLIKLENCSEGDIIDVEAWRNGPHGMIVISNDEGTKLYQASGEVQSKEEEWQKMNYSVRIPPSMYNERVSCYLAYFESADSCYFDDIKITLRRAQ